MEPMVSVAPQMYKFFKWGGHKMEKPAVCVLFVCMGNICRSPAGEGILKHLLKQEKGLNLHIESCGIGDWHLGQTPDWRMQEAAKARGVILTSRAQQFQRRFLDEFDYILAADKEIMEYLCRYARIPEHQAKMMLMTNFSSNYNKQEVPDPYYLANGAFELVLDMLEDSCQGLLKHIRQHQKT
jgi:protein-tyrosine phosphatase